MVQSATSGYKGDTVAGRCPHLGFGLDRQQEASIWLLVKKCIWVFSQETLAHEHPTERS